jgi:predicted ferric reductase
MLRSLTSKESDYNIDFYYSVRDENSFAFRQEIEEIGNQNKNLNIFFWDSKKEGLLTASLIKEKTKDIQDRDILICGPPIMMDALKKQFLNLGVKKSQIYMEEFQLY